MAQEWHASMASTLKLLLLTRLVEDNTEAAVLMQLPGAEPPGSRSSSGSDSEDGGRPAMTREEAAAALEGQLSDLPPDDLVELINQLLRDEDLPPEVAARNPTQADREKNKQGQKSGWLAVACMARHAGCGVFK